MKIDTLRRSIMLCRAARITPFIWGNLGIGKSSAVRGLATTEHMGCVDFRLSQVEASDLRGLPSKENGRTVYYPPAEMPSGDLEWNEYQKLLGEAGDRAWDVVGRLQPRLKNGFLFLDEANRCQDDVSQAVFQLVLEGKIGAYTLPPGWTVVAAGNFMSGYMTNGFTDPAFISRFCHLTLSGDESTQGEWVNYMEAEHTTYEKDIPDADDLGTNHAQKVIEFAAQNTDHLYCNVKGDLDFSIKPSPRAWDAVARVQTILAKKDYGDDAAKEVIAGLVGRELSISFMNYNCPVRPDDLIQKGVQGVIKQLNEIINKKEGRQMIMGLMWGVASKLRKNIDNDAMAKVAMDFTRFLCNANKDKDIAVAFCNQMMAGNSAPNQLKSSMLSNPRVIHLISRWAKGKSFISRLSNDPELHDLVAKTSWGSTGT